MTNPSSRHEKETPTNVNIKCDEAVTICSVRSIGINFRKSGISEKSAEQAINEEDNPFKDITADLEETISLSFANDCPKKPGRAECN